MGNMEFLISSNGESFGNIEEAIQKLKGLSYGFMAQINLRNIQEAVKISERAFECLDHIHGELLRIRDDQRDERVYDRSSFQHAMSTNSARMATIGSAERSNNTVATPGNARFPNNLEISYISLEKTLNKIKHRNRKLIDFRIDAGKHILMIRPKGELIEIDIIDFCENCLRAVESLA